MKYRNLRVKFDGITIDQSKLKNPLAQVVSNEKCDLDEWLDSDVVQRGVTDW